MDHLAILSQTIADHARKLAHEEWTTEYSEFWQQILAAAGLTTKSGTSTLDVDGHAIPIESITKPYENNSSKSASPSSSRSSLIPSSKQPSRKLSTINENY